MSDFGTTVYILASLAVCGCRKLEPVLHAPSKGLSVANHTAWKCQGHSWRTPSQRKRLCPGWTCRFGHCPIAGLSRAQPRRRYIERNPNTLPEHTRTCSEVAGGLLQQHTICRMYMSELDENRNDEKDIQLITTHQTNVWTCPGRCFYPRLDTRISRMEASITRKRRFVCLTIQSSFRLAFLTWKHMESIRLMQVAP